VSGGHVDRLLTPGQVRAVLGIAFTTADQGHAGAVRDGGGPCDVERFLDRHGLPASRAG
jgi:hypothetical protein